MMTSVLGSVLLGSADVTFHSDNTLMDSEIRLPEVTTLAFRAGLVCH